MKKLKTTKKYLKYKQLNFDINKSIKINLNHENNYLFSNYRSALENSIKIQQKINASISQFYSIHYPYLERIQQQMEYISECISKYVNQLPNILNREQLDNINDIYMEVFSRLIKIDWYLPFWFDIFDDNNLYDTLDILLDDNYNHDELKIVDDELFKLINHLFEDEKNFINMFGSNHEFLYFMLLQENYKEIMMICLAKIDEILTLIWNSLNGKEVSELSIYQYLSFKNPEERKKYISPFSRGATQDDNGEIKDEINEKLNKISIETLSKEQRTTIKILKEIFPKKRNSQLYNSFERESKKNKMCELTPVSDIPLCRNLVFHGMLFNNEIDRKMAIKSLMAFFCFRQLKVIITHH